MENRVLERLMALTHDNSAEVRGAAAAAFGDSGYKATTVIDRLIALTHDNTAVVRAEAAKALGRIFKK